MNHRGHRVRQQNIRFDDFNSVYSVNSVVKEVGCDG